MPSKRSVLLRYAALTSTIIVIAHCIYLYTKKSLSFFYFTGWITTGCLLLCYMICLTRKRFAQRYHNGLAALVLLLSVLQILWTGINPAAPVILRVTLTASSLISVLAVKTAWVIFYEKQESVLLLFVFVVYTVWLLFVVVGWW